MTVDHDVRTADPDVIADYARRARRLVLRTVCSAGTGHLGADLSAVDLLCTLYFGVLRVRPGEPDPDRDRFVLSKAHAAAAMYSVLALRGFLDESELETFAAGGSRLATVVSTRAPGVEFNTGSLGHGLPLAVGSAMAARITGRGWRTFALTGDGELQEGSNWEAAMFAASRKLSDLTVVVDRNLVQKGASTEDINALEPLEDKWRAFGWTVRGVDGHDLPQLLEALRAPAVDGRPTCLIARTVKGKGVSFMEGGAGWHSRRLTPELRDRALAELDGTP